MEDILLENGDLVILKSQDNYEFEVDKDVVGSLIKRALQTPIGHIRISVIDNKELRLIDADFGDEIYKELSEGITINFISRVRQHILNAIKKIDIDLDVRDVSVGVIEDNKINIVLYFEDNKIIEVPVNL